MTRPLPGRQTLTLGGEFVDNVDQNQWGAYPFASSDNFTLDQSSRQGAAYVQDEIRLRPWLIVNGGLRHDRYSRFNRTTPRGAVIVMPSANHSLKYLYGRAFRAPNAYELYYYRDASAYLQPESIDTHEWVWEAYFGERVRTAVSTYRYKASQLVDLRIVDPDATHRRSGLRERRDDPRGRTRARKRDPVEARRAGAGELRAAGRQGRGAGRPAAHQLSAAYGEAEAQRSGPAGSLVRIVRMAVPEHPDDPRGHDRRPGIGRKRDRQPADRTLGDDHRADSQSVQRPLRRPGLGGTPGRFDRTERADGPSRAPMGVLEAPVKRDAQARTRRSRRQSLMAVWPARRAGGGAVGVAPGLKAAYLFNFAQFVEWPADVVPAGAPLALCIVNDDAVADALERTIKGRTVDGHDLAVRHLRTGAPLPTCHVLYLAGARSETLARRRRDSQGVVRPHRQRRRSALRRPAGWWNCSSKAAACDSR